MRKWIMWLYRIILNVFKKKPIVNPGKPKTLEELNKQTVEEVKAKKCSLSLDPEMVETKRYVSPQKKRKKKVVNRNGGYLKD